MWMRIFSHRYRLVAIPTALEKKSENATYQLTTLPTEKNQSVFAKLGTFRSDRNNVCGESQTN